MTRSNTRLPSEQIPNDGGYHLPRLVKEANARLKKIGKHGKRATIKVTAKPNKPISAQFNHPIQRQKQFGINLQLTTVNLVKAEEICTLVTHQLVAGTFTDDWFYKLIGKEDKLQNSDRDIPLTCKEMLEQYRVHYFNQRKDNKTPQQNWLNYYGHIEKILSQYDKVITLSIVREIINCTENNTFCRKHHLEGLANLLKHFDNNEFKAVIKKYKSENNPKHKNKHIPDDNEITNIYHHGFEINLNCPKKYRYRYPQWQFLYALLATYGLRVHEAWNIKNWYNPVVLKDGDWLATAGEDIETPNDDDDEGKYFWQKYQGSNLTIPAILDPTNERKLLAIGHKTKTGYRIAFPLSPNGRNWLDEFNLLGTLNLPDIPDPLGYGGKKATTSRNCTGQACLWFRKHKYGFTPHALRHAYNIRGHKLGVNQKVLSDSLGHGLQMNSSTYLRHEGDRSKLEGIIQEMDKDSLKRSYTEQLEAENKALKTENERLRAELAMMKAIEDSI